MQKTNNYNLNKPESTDPLRVADFNQNSDIIDAALKNLNTAMGTKAEQSAVNALTTAVAAKGNCSVEAGTYTGDGNYDYDKENTLTFSKKPLAVFIGGAGYTAILLSGSSNCLSVDPNGSVRTVYPTWGSDGTLSWYASANSGHQMNTKNTTYTYFALLN